VSRTKSKKEFVSFKKKKRKKKVLRENNGGIRLMEDEHGI
jgi:hypothetical protein